MKASKEPDRPSSPGEQPAQSESDEFARYAGQHDPGLVREFIDFLRYNKKWWLTPILVITLLMVALAFLSASPAAPFIYTLF